MNEQDIRVGMISLGCAKNQVDAERMLYMLQEGGFVLHGDPSQCDVVVINTCGFIEDAKRESIDYILQSIAQKDAQQVRVVVVTGCLAERYRDEMAKEIPEADVILGIGSNHNICEAVRQALSGHKVRSYGDKQALSLEGGRILGNANYFAYLKVAEGCDNRCSYCAIPLIRGGFRSRRLEDVVAEAEQLASMGVTELNVVAQDTTRYGEDLYGTSMLPELLRRLCRIHSLHWVRVLYCYPERITDELLDVMASEEKIVKYLDVPVQHASGKVLKAMNRRGDAASLTMLMQHVRSRVPGIVLRTTLISGFPGETDADFEELCTFVQRVRFDRLGCFPYSREEDTPAYDYPAQVDEEIKQHRAQIIMETQMQNASELGSACIGKQLEVLCEGYDDEMECWYGRSAMDAPDIDTKVYFVTRSPVAPGEYVFVRITDTTDYDLIGEREEVAL